MNETLTITQARAELLDIPGKLAKDKTIKSVTVTKRGKPILAILEWELFESIMETLEVMGDPELMTALRRGIREAESGRALPWKRAKQRLGL